MMSYLVTDELVELACETYEREYLNNDKTMQEAMRSALVAVVARFSIELPNLFTAD